MKSIGDWLRGIPPPSFGHVCPTCGSASNTPRPCLGCEQAARLAREARLVTAASIPPRFEWATSLDALEFGLRVDRVALEEARAMDLRRLDRATLLGPAGAGKTALAVGLATGWTRVTARSALFIAAIDVGTARREHGLGEGAPRIVRDALAAPLIVLDDLGQELDSGAADVAHVIQRRYDDEKPTIATSGLAVEQLLSRYGAGVVRRLLEAAGGAVVLKLRSRGGRGGAQ
jgi:DNA replication protein DnaC